MGDFTEHFDEIDFFVSEDFPELAKNAYALRSPAEVEALYSLTSRIIEPAREYAGIPLRITSGFRSPALNNALRRKYGTAKNSLHQAGIAADFTTWRAKDRHRLREIFEYIHASREYGQLILYQYESGGYRNIHVSLPSRHYHDDKRVMAIKTVKG